MKAMILAAGKGTRIRPLTYELPKPMIPIMGKPVMEYLVELLAKHGVKQIMVNLSHLPQRIEHYFGDGRRFGVEIGYSFEGYIQKDEMVPFALGSAGGMRKIQDFGGFFDETTVVLCGDAMIDLDITAAVQEHKRRGAMVSLVAKEMPWEEVSSYGVIVADEDGRIISFQEKPSLAEARSNLINTGIYIFEPEALNLIPEGQIFDIGADLFPLLVESGVTFHAITQAFNWIDIGKVADYWHAMQRVMLGEVEGIHMPGREIRPGVWVGLNTHIDWRGTQIEGPVYIGSGTCIEAGCQIVGPTWIGHGCYIHEDVKLTRSILFEHTRVREAVEFDEQIVVGDYCVSKHGKTIRSNEVGLEWIWCDARVMDVMEHHAAMAS
ncbi:NDP-sugar synthase [Methylobacillus gramineus]|uniref:sugar phosphate nucleotidyltransferase n=1 Tax=Methylobacillus gramineus TaxID=755169 RepID=UPI001CFFDC68|nr:NDP-sugar synthase [Methylobacillus gramineus]MCB5186054.1 NDP-sugar synthase [Methylobacillus gramineus]